MQTNILIANQIVTFATQLLGSCFKLENDPEKLAPKRTDVNPSMENVKKKPNAIVANTKTTELEAKS